MACQTADSHKGDYLTLTHECTTNDEIGAPRHIDYLTQP
jgi:hypothetical protein